ncbi:hypothetical protein CAOG_010158 [Capsaspora owczarzaki ATCC 30864]|uniref:Uncharacterized protein n=1 Tax=Capsaspora owczarzaki (strain ATCC 30864) TaxID=595528 RepID=A0A0D2W0S0_CAPO3|nr:hypothetical protein CAOG_010158 [Capsaspora owczarzaki ATCC 30864]
MSAEGNASLGIGLRLLLLLWWVLQLLRLGLLLRLRWLLGSILHWLLCLLLLRNGHGGGIGIGHEEQAFSTLAGILFVGGLARVALRVGLHLLIVVAAVEMGRQQGCIVPIAHGGEILAMLGRDDSSRDATEQTLARRC